MKVNLEINNQTIEFERNWFTGSFTYTTNGVRKTLDSALNPFTHFSVQLSRAYEVQIGESVITVIKTRPLFFAGLRTHNYKFYVDKNLVKELDAM
ncbi:hypothetical protein GCM10022217_02300 [Chryseobacterium ginsenosidimutans]|uniref:hypothetical protein n=1 Tax=Chryseobacterium ginsenosidimutans TaxID=687846 RepID=UPI0031DB9E9F